MNISSFDALFKVDFNLIRLNGQPICWEFIEFILSKNPILNNTDGINKIKNWLDYERHLDKNIEASFETNFNIPYNTLPIKFKDFNLNNIRINWSKDLANDFRYINYLKSKEYKIKEFFITLNNITTSPNTLTSKHNYYGEFSEIPFLYAFTETANYYYNSQKHKEFIKNFQKYNQEQKCLLLHTYFVILTTNIHSNNLKLWDDSDKKIKTATIAILTEMKKSFELLSTQNFAA